MPDIHFQCDGCTKSLAIESRGAGMQVSCPDCGKKLIVPPANQPAALPPVVAPPLPKKSVVAGHAPVLCEKCKAAMQKTKKVDKSLLLQIVGVFVFFFGLSCLILFPIGTVIGIILMIAAARMGYSKKPVWLCPNCGFFFERAK